MTLENALHRFRLAWQRPVSNDEIRPAAHALVHAADDAQRRIVVLEHALRHASERFSWLGSHHVSTPFAEDACRKMADEFWSLQSREDSAQ